MDETGKVEAKVEVTNKAVSEAAKSGESVALPMPEVPAAKSTESAPSVSINMPASTGTVKVYHCSVVLPEVLKYRVLPPSGAVLSVTTDTPLPMKEEVFHWASVVDSKLPFLITLTASL